jgi:hypothetical protein
MKKRRMGTHIIVDRAACGPQAAMLICPTHCMLHEQILDFKHFITEVEKYYK